jgi:hypothetical protein
MITLEQLQPDGLKRLLEKQWSEEGQKFKGGAKRRKDEFDTRLCIDTEQHRHLIVSRIFRLFKSADIAAAVAEHADTRRNIAKRVIDRIATPYETPPIRELQGLPEATQLQFLDAYREAETDTTAATWSRYAALCNVVHVIPRIESDDLDDGALRWVTVLPHEADVLFDPKGERDPSILVYTCHDQGARWVAVDREWWWWLSKDWQVLGREPTNSLGLTPWAEFRVAPRQPGDYWNRGAGRNLVDGSLQVGLVSAQMEWVRRTHANKMITLALGQNDETPPGQVMQGEAPVITRGDNTRFTVHDTIVSVDEFEKHIASIVADIAEAYGLPATEIDPAPASTSDAANVFGPAGPRVFERITKLRTSMLTHLRRAETRLAITTGAVLSETGRLRGATPQQIKKAFKVSWLPPTFADTPKSQIDTANAGIDIGTTNAVAFYQQQNPGTTFAEAEAAVMRNFEIRAKLNDFQASRNLPRDPRDDAKTLAQLQGRIGGQRSAETRSSDDDQSGDEYDA